MKEQMKDFVGNMRRGFVRFAPFNVGAVLLTAFVIWQSHVPWKARGTESLLPTALACGTCWGMLTALATRLFAERRTSRRMLLDVLPAVCGFVAAVVGSWFWYNVREGHVHYQVWQMVYFGGTTALAAMAVASLFRERNRRTLFGQLFQSAVFVALISFVTMLGGLLCFFAYQELIVKISDKYNSDVCLVVWCAVAPIFMVSCLPQGDDVTERSRWYNVLFWFLTPIGLLLIAILYAYIVKIAVNGAMPSGKMNWYASWALAAYLFFWLCLRESRVRLFAWVARWGWAALVPVVVTQIVGIVIRYQAHGLTTPRMAGMVTLGIGIYALVLAALDRDAKSAFVVTALAGLFFTLTPLNVVDLPLREQSARLRRVLAKNGCLDADGRLAVPENPSIPLDDAKTLVSAGKYLANVHSFCNCSKDAKVRPGVWYKAAFAQSIMDAVAAKRKDGNFSALLKIDESSLESPKSRSSYVSHSFWLNGDSLLDVSGFSRMGKPRDFRLSGKPGGPYSLTISFPKVGLPDATQAVYDVTEPIEKIVSATSANLKWENGSYNSYNFEPDLAMWRLSNNMTLAVTKLFINFTPGKAESLNAYGEGALLIKDAKK